MNRQATISRILELQAGLLEYRKQSGEAGRFWRRIRVLSKQIFVYVLVGKRLSKALGQLIQAVKDRKRPYLGPELANALEAASRKIMGYKRWLILIGLMTATPGMLSVGLLWQQNHAMEVSKNDRIADLRNNKRVELLITIYQTRDKTESGSLSTPIFSASNRRNAVFELIRWDAERLSDLEQEDLFRLSRMVDLSIAPLNDIDFSPIPGEQPFHFKDIGFVNSNFENSSFEGCKFEHVWFSSARLFGTYFRGARFKEVSFDQALIKGADFSNAEFVMCDFEGAVFDAKTRWPEGFDPVQFGAIPAEEIE